MTSETIVAPLTAVGGAVAAIRISGPGVALLRDDLETTLRPRMAHHVRYPFGDDGLAIFFPAPHSATGEDVLEASFHGSPAAMRAALAWACEKGARLAHPGEFTQRAFLNGKLDLNRAEAVADLVASATERQFRVASQAERAAELDDPAIRLENALLRIEADVDFSEEMGELDRPEMARSLRAVADALDSLARRATAQNRLRGGATIALVGRPNVGKSALFNRVLGETRAIVSPHAGTTRDVLREAVEYRGYPLLLLDLAGIRETHDPVEAEGVARAEAALTSADLVWRLASPDLPERDPLPHSRALDVATKADLGATDGLPVSALTGQGIDALLEATLERIDWGEGAYLGPAVGDACREAADATREAARVLDSDFPVDLAVGRLRDALETLNHARGRGGSPRDVSAIFARFCLGK